MRKQGVSDTGLRQVEKRVPVRRAGDPGTSCFGRKQMGHGNRKIKRKDFQTPSGKGQGESERQEDGFWFLHQWPGLEWKKV